MKRALTPGTFDPITSGHLDVIARASQLVDEVVVAVADSQKKGPLFTLEERVELETLFIMSPPQYMYLSSSIVREISKMGGDIQQFVPPCVYEALKKKYANLQ